jgi:hypothetical protein
MLQAPYTKELDTQSSLPERHARMVSAEVYTAGKHSLQELVTSIPGGLSATLP